MRKAPLNRGSKPLRRDTEKARAFADQRSELSWDTPMPKVNRERMERRAEEDRVYGSIHKFTKTLPCLLAFHPLHRCAYYADRPNVESHHVKSVGSGGEDRNGTVPICPGGHDEAHRLGLVRWCEFYRLDFRSLACEVTARYDAENPTEENLSE